jgi:hypothetical protein
MFAAEPRDVHPTLARNLHDSVRAIARGKPRSREAEVQRWIKIISPRPLRLLSVSSASKSFPPISPGKKRRMTSQSERTQPSMPFRTCSRRPTILTISLRNRQVINACQPHSHQAVLVELPILIPVRAKPVSGVVAPLVRESHRNPVLPKCPQFLDEPVFQFSRPLPLQEGDNLLAPVNELRAIPPARVHRVGKRNSLWILCVPCVFRPANLLDGALMGEWWDGWSPGQSYPL